MLIDKDQCLTNIEHMVRKCRSNNIRLRPHFKTHHSIEIGNWFKSFGVEHITVSSYEMAQYFSNNWDNITVAIPVNLQAISVINHLAESITLNVLVEDVETVKALGERLVANIGVYLKIDTGYGRTGILASDDATIQSVISAVHSLDKLELKGLLAHAGHTYHASSKEEILEIGQDCMLKLQLIKQNLGSSFSELELSIGDTPFCSLADSFEGVDEIRPGNFIFYDLMQAQIGSNSIEQISVCLAAPILSIHNERRTMVVHGGGIHLSKDRITDRDGLTIYGIVVRLTEAGWTAPLEGFYLKNLSQEHGIIEWTEGVDHNFKVGEMVGILPVHSCMTANLHGHYHTLHGERIEKFRID